MSKQEARALGRDRDPFERSLLALRERLTAPAAARGLTLAVAPLAEAFGVSPTPVREALAHLAGEGLVARSASGYRTKPHDRASLAALYALAGVLVEVALAEGLAAQGEAPAAPTEAQAALVALPSRTRNRALGAAIARVLGQLAPFRPAERAVLGPRDGESLAGALAAPGPRAAMTARAYFRRRGRRAGEILAAALGLD